IGAARRAGDRAAPPRHPDAIEPAAGAPAAPAKCEDSYARAGQAPLRCGRRSGHGGPHVAETDERWGPGVPERFWGCAPGAETPPEVHEEAAAPAAATSPAADV